MHLFTLELDEMAITDNREMENFAADMERYEMYDHETAASPHTSFLCSSSTDV